MGRPPREEEAGAIHHVIPRANGNRRIVEDDRDRVAYARSFAAATREFGWLIHASCLLDTHHHAVLETSEPNLGLGMRQVLGGYSRWTNARHGRKGSVFKPHFWSRRITDEAWFFRACLYVVLNPVVAGVCSHPRDWPWCSYGVTAEGDPDVFAPGEELLLGMFGDTPREARRNYAQLVDESVANILENRRFSPPDVWQALGELALRTVSDLRSDTGTASPP